MKKNKKEEPLFEVRYGGKRKVRDCEPEEWMMFDKVYIMFKSFGGNPGELRFERYSKDYLTAKYGEWDLARIHWGPRSKWIMFPTVEHSSTRHRIHSVDEVLQFEDLIKRSMEHIEEYS